MKKVRWWLNWSRSGSRGKGAPWRKGGLMKARRRGEVIQRRRSGSTTVEERWLSGGRGSSTEEK